MTFDGGDAAIWSRCLQLPFGGNWGLQLIAAVKFNAQDKLLILPGVSVRPGRVGQEAVTRRVQRWLLGSPSSWVSAAAALRIAEGISRKPFLGPEQLGIFIRSESHPVEYCSSLLPLLKWKQTVFLKYIWMPTPWAPRWGCGLETSETWGPGG